MLIYSRNDRVEGESEVHELPAAVVEPVEGSESQHPLFTDLQTETYENVVISGELSATQSQEVRRLLFEYRDIFTDVPSVTTLGKHMIELTSNHPIREKAYVLPHAMRGVVDKEFDTMEKLGVIELSSASYASPNVIVKKSDGSNRVCVDYRRLNKITVFDPESLQPQRKFSQNMRGISSFQNLT